MPEFSVIIPIRNSDSTLKHCLDSVLGQSCSEWEALCVYDDCADNSKKVIDEYCEKDNRFIFIHGRNKGLSGARNDGIRESKGKYILFLDSDDSFLPDAFSRIRREFEKLNCDIVVFGTKIVPETPRAGEWYYNALKTPERFYPSFSEKALFEEKSARPFVWRNAFSSSFIKENNLLFEEECTVGEDQVFQLCAFPYAKNGISFIKDVLYQYTWLRQGSLMAEYGKDKVFRLRGHIKMVEFVFRYWENNAFRNLSQKSIAIWAIYFLSSEIPYLEQKKINLLADDIIHLFDTQYMSEHSLKLLPQICRKKALMVKSCKLQRRTRLDFLRESLYWKWYWGGAMAAMRVFYEITTTFIANKITLGVKKMTLKGRLFEKSLFLHRKIAKKFGFDLVLKKESAEIPIQTPYIETTKNIQNEAWFKQVFSRLQSETTDSTHLNIAFIVPAPIKGSGGHRNIYRAVKFLKKNGHDLTVYYINTELDADTVKQQISDWFYDMEDIPFIHYEGQLGYHDVCVATWWETAYAIINNRTKIKYPFYFVQDYEPSFYPTSSAYILCENTYKQGFMHICSGPWCKAFLNNKYNARAEYFQFPVDRNVYNMSEKRTKTNQNIIFFAKPEMPRRCYEIGIQALQEFHKLAPNVEIILFGSNNVGDVSFPVTKLGILPTIQDLASLYRNADLGIVFSTTNPSLVPYEMMHCGLPVVDLDLEFALSKYGNNNDTVFLFDSRPNVMAKQIFESLNNKALLEIKKKSALDWVMKEFPSEDEMGQIVQSIIVNEVKNNAFKN